LRVDNSAPVETPVRLKLTVRPEDSKNPRRRALPSPSRQLNDSQPSPGSLLLLLSQLHLSIGPYPPYPGSLVAFESFGELMKTRAGSALALIMPSRSCSLLFRRARSFDEEVEDEDEDSERDVATAEAKRAEFAAAEAAEAREAREAAAVKVAELVNAETEAATCLVGRGRHMWYIAGDCPRRRCKIHGSFIGTVHDQVNPILSSFPSSWVLIRSFQTSLQIRDDQG